MCSLEEFRGVSSTGSPHSDTLYYWCFNGLVKDKSYACLPNLARNQMGQNYNGCLVKVSTSEDKMKFCLL